MLPMNYTPRCCDFHYEGQILRDILDGLEMVIGFWGSHPIIFFYWGNYGGGVPPNYCIFPQPNNLIVSLLAVIWNITCSIWIILILSQVLYGHLNSGGSWHTLSSSERVCGIDRNHENDEIVFWWGKYSLKFISLPFVGFTQVFVFVVRSRSVRISPFAFF